ncbi:MAG: hypothetical protein Q7S65_01965 [Nanoarchaeota archaeon]|nr:hypothetical protein [Nanoarchaeota archaeon]
MHKRAAAFKMLNWATWRLIFLSIFLFVTFALTSSYIHNNFDVSSIRARIGADRILIASSEVSSLTQRSYPGTLDLDLLTSENLDRRIETDDGRFSASIIVSRSDKELANLAVNQKWLERYEPLTTFKEYSSNLFWRYALVNGEECKMLVKTVQHG